MAPPVPKNRLQLIGITCLFMSCRVEESSPPSLEDLAGLTNGAVTAKEIQQLITISRGLKGKPIPFKDLKDLGWGPDAGKTHTIPQQELEPVREPEQKSQSQESQSPRSQSQSHPHRCKNRDKRARAR